MPNEESSPEMSAIGGQLMRITPYTIKSMSEEDLTVFARQVRSLAASVVTQDENNVDENNQTD